MSPTATPKRGKMAPASPSCLSPLSESAKMEQEQHAVELFTKEVPGLLHLIEKTTRDFTTSEKTSTDSLTLDDIRERFMLIEPDRVPPAADVGAYFSKMLEDIVRDGIHTAAPTMVGHMTSALPCYTSELAKLIAAMNQNVVKTETAKTVTFAERETMARVHRVLYQNEESFYASHVQSPDSVLGVFTSGGTLANLTALWVARNKGLGPIDGTDADNKSKKPSFPGCTDAGVVPALLAHGWSRAVVLGSDLLHYSIDKALDLLGFGSKAVVRVPLSNHGAVNVDLLKAEIARLRAENVFVMAMVGICGATETGTIDPLAEMAELAAEEGIFFHVDAAWGGGMIFSGTHRWQCAGIEKADSVTIDGHKQLWLPMGCGMVFFKDPCAVHHVQRTAAYIIRKGSHDLGRFTLEGSRPANALYLHAAMHIFGLRGFQLLYDKTVRTAQYMAGKVLASSNYELLVKPQTNILLYRWVPASLRKKVGTMKPAPDPLNVDVEQEEQEGNSPVIPLELTAEDQKTIDEANCRLQELQKLDGRTFVSRTTCPIPKYGNTRLVALRVVIGNPLTSVEHIDAVFGDQNRLINSGAVSKDFSEDHPEVFISRGSLEAVEGEGGVVKGEPYWRQVWNAMGLKEKEVWGDDIENFLRYLR